MNDKDNIKLFPTNRIKDKKNVGKNVDDKEHRKIVEQQTKEFVETSVDEISLNLLKRLYDLAIKTNKKAFTKDLAMLVDVLRGLIYRDFGMKHPSQVLSEKMVEIRVLKDGSQSARINYDIFKKGKTVPLNPEVKEELKDGPGIFEPEGDLDK